MDGWFMEGSSKSGRFLERMEQELDWSPIQRRLEKMYPSRNGRPSHPPMAVFRMILLEHFYTMSDPQCEEQVRDRLSFRKFVGLGWNDPIPDETTLVRFRQRMIEYGVQNHLLEIVNRQLEQKGLIVKTATIVDATLVKAATRPPTREEQSQGEGKDPEASYTSKGGKSHYGYKAHVASDADHGMIRKATLTTASLHDHEGFEGVLPREQEIVYADKAYRSQKHEAFLAKRKTVSGIMEKGYRGKKLTRKQKRSNRWLARVRCGIEKIFGHWKRNLGYDRVRYLGIAKNELELTFKCLSWNLRRMVTVLEG